MKPSVLLLLGFCLIAACMDQESNREDSYQKINNDSLAGLEQQTLREWTDFNTRADSIVGAAEASIASASEGLATRRVHQRAQIRRAIMKVDYQLERLREQIAAVEDFETATDTFSLMVVRKLDSLREEFDKRKLALDRSLLELREYDNAP